MDKIIKLGQLLFGIAITVFGVENLINAHRGLAVRGVPWFPANTYRAYVAGIVLLSAGLGMVTKFSAACWQFLYCIFVSYPEARLRLIYPERRNSLDGRAA